MRATLANMKRLCTEHDPAVAFPGVVAHSFETGETSSASPGDYSWMADADCLTVSEGNEMVLVREIRTVIMQEIDDTD